MGNIITYPLMHTPLRMEEWPIINWVDFSHSLIVCITPLIMISSTTFTAPLPISLYACQFLVQRLFTTCANVAIGIITCVAMLVEFLTTSRILTNESFTLSKCVCHIPNPQNKIALVGKYKAIIRMAITCHPSLLIYLLYLFFINVTPRLFQLQEHNL